MKPEALPTRRASGSWIHRHVFTTDHRAIGCQYYVLALIAVLVGVLLSLLMRVHLVEPDLLLPFWGVIKPEDYLALVTMHGTLMVFFVLTTAPQSGFGNMVLAEQIGSRSMAFPRLNAASFWLTALAFIVLIAGFVVPGGAPISGWTSYPPLSAIASAGPGQGLGMDCWIASIGIFCFASTLAAVNFLTTITKKRCAGMTLGRMPLTVWSWYVTAMLMLLVFSVLLAAVLLLFCDRHLGTSFFLPPSLFVNGTVVTRQQDGSPLLWQHLFWFFGHPEVYIAILPAMGITSTILSNFCRRPVFAYRGMVCTTLAIAFLGLLVWGHHMFVSGLNPYAGTAFALVTMAIAVPSAAKTLSWLTMLWQSKLELTVPMLFTIGFISLFVTGGLTGPVLAQPMLDSYLHNTYFVLAHFHLIMGMAGVFAIFAGTYYWFPLITGRAMNPRLGKLHFWLTLIGAYAVFFPMHFAGLGGMPRHYSEMTGPAATLASLLPLQRLITFAAMMLAFSQIIFLWNLRTSLLRGPAAAANPWRATTLEWAGPEWWQRPKLSVSRGPYEYGSTAETNFPQSEPASRLHDDRQE